MHSYARNVNLKRKCGKKYVGTRNLIFFENNTVIFLISNVLYPFGLFSWNNGLNVPDYRAPWFITDFTVVALLDVIEM